MPFKKGAKKTGGRGPGVTNKVTKELRENIQELLESEFPNWAGILETLKAENPVAYMTLNEKLLSYVVPKKKDITSDGEAIKIVPISGVNIIKDDTNKQPSTKAG